VLATGTGRCDLLNRHADDSYRDSLTCDLMQPVRPQVDAFVFDWTSGKALKTGVVLRAAKRKLPPYGGLRLQSFRERTALASGGCAIRGMAGSYMLAEFMTPTSALARSARTHGIG
jgi:hypothetical protein